MNTPKLVIAYPASASGAKKQPITLAQEGISGADAKPIVLNPGESAEIDVAPAIGWSIKYGA